MKDGWIKTQISEVALVQSGSGFPDKYQGMVGQPIPFYKVSDMNISGNEREMIYENNSITDKVRKELGAFLFPKGSIIFPKIGGAIATNKKRRTTRECCVDNNVMGVIPKPEKIDGDFLYYFFLAHDLSEFANKAHLPSIKKTVVEAWDISLPTAQAEQRRIVNVLRHAFEGVATAAINAEKNHQNARALFESYLQSVFTEGGKGWTDSTIGAEIRFIDYRGKTPVKTSDGVRLITAKNVKMGYLQETPMEFIAAASYKGWMTRGIPQKGDVLFTTEAPLANIAQLDTDEKVAFAQRIIIMQPNAAKLDSAFLKYLLLSQPVQQRIRTKGTGATVQGIKASLLKTIEISFPKSLAEQEQIVTKLDGISEQTRRLSEVYEHKLSALATLKKSLLHQAFSGNL
jgi:type I restriction enzyme S subunit